MISIEVQNFGSIEKSCLDLSPLTVFVGVNNSGKSYMATLVYSLFQALPLFKAERILRAPYGRRANPDQFTFGFPYRPQPIGPKTLELLSSKKLQDGFNTLLKNKKFRKASAKIAFTDLDEDLRSILNEALRVKISESASYISGEISRCFGVEIGDLSRRANNKKRPFRIQITGTQPNWNLELKLKNGVLHATLNDADASACVFGVDQLLFYGRFRTSEVMDTQDLRVGLAMSMLHVMESHVFVEMLQNSFYLPAARSGILQSHKALMRTVMKEASLAGIETLDIPRLTGIVTDFISNVMSLELRRKGPFESLASELETGILGGNIVIKGTKYGHPDIFYLRATEEFPLHGTSSMVSELAPVILYLRHLVLKGDLLIIEEPEAHLHPDAQRLFARLIPHLVNNHVTVLLTTHSDFFLAQLNNFIRLDSVSNEWRTARGFTNADLLSAKRVAAYLFSVNSDTGGTITQTLEVDSKDGISDNVFATVVEDLYQESSKLQHQIQKTGK